MAAFAHAGEERKLTGQHVHVGTVGDAENVRRDLITAFADVHLDDTVGVDREALVRVDGDAEETRIGLWLFYIYKLSEKRMN